MELIERYLDILDYDKPYTLHELNPIAITILGMLRCNHLSEAFMRMYSPSYVNMLWYSIPSSRNIELRYPPLILPTNKYYIVFMGLSTHANVLFIDLENEIIDRFEPEFRPLDIDHKYDITMQIFKGTYFNDFTYNNNRSENKYDYVQDINGINRKYGNDKFCAYYCLLYCKYRLEGLTHEAAYDRVKSCTVADVKKLVYCMYYGIKQI